MVETETKDAAENLQRQQGARDLATGGVNTSTSATICSATFMEGGEGQTINEGSDVEDDEDEKKPQSELYCLRVYAPVSVEIQLQVHEVLVQVLSVFLRFIKGGCSGNRV